MKFIKIFIIFVSLFVFSGAFADTKTIAIELEVAKIVRTPAFVESVLNENGLVGMPREVVREHLQELYKSNEVIELLVKEVINAGGLTWFKDKQSDYRKKFGAELFLSYAMKGMSRLTTDEQKIFFKFLLNWLQVASADDCKKLLVSGGTNILNDAKIEIKYYHRMEKEELRRYYSMLRKSIFAELTGYPNARTLNQQQAKIADDAFENALMKRIENGLMDDKILNAMADISKADSKLACLAGQQIFSTILSMKGFSGELLITKFVNSFQ